MRKFFTTLSVLVGVVLLSYTNVSAQAVIDNTGPGSNNTIDQTTNTNCSVTNNNQVSVENNNNQSSESGESDSDINTNSSDSTTGDSSNSSSSETVVGIDNNDSCVATQTRTVGGKGSGTAQIAAKTPAPTQVTKTPVGGVAAGNASLVDTIRVFSVLGLSGASIAFGLKRYNSFGSDSIK